MSIKKKISAFKQYFETTVLYEIILTVPRIFKKYPQILSFIVIMIFVVGIATYPIIFKMLNKDNSTTTEYVTHQSNPLKQDIYVTVTGEVKNPGMYQLTTDNRINDAIQKAGGFTENAYTENINLAQILSDGQYIKVLSKEYAESLETGEVTSEAPEFHGIVNINTATAEELCQLPGIGEATALKIIEYRDLTDGFEHVEDIQNVKGIGPSKYNKIKYNITI